MFLFEILNLSLCHLETITVWLITKEKNVTQHCQQLMESSHTLVLVDADECGAIT